MRREAVMANKFFNVLFPGRAALPLAANGMIAPLPLAGI